MAGLKACTTAALLLWVTAISATARPVRIAFVFSEGNISGTMKTSPQVQAAQQAPLPSHSPVAQDLSAALPQARKGYLMEEKERSRSSPRNPVPITVPLWVMASLTLPVLAYLLVRRRRHRRR